MRTDEGQFLLCIMALIAGIGLWFSITFYALHQKIDLPAFQTFLDQHVYTSSSTILYHEDFISSYTGIHDSYFFSHRGIHFARDLQKSFQRLGRGERKEADLNLTRQVAAHIVAKGKFGGFYRNYMLPALIEKELNKQSILKISKQLRQREAGITYDQIMAWLELENTNDYSRYHWILLHSLFESVSVKRTTVYKTETVFFDYLTKLYASGFVQDSDIEEIYLRYRTDFLNDTALFFNNYRSATQTITRQTRLGGAIQFAELAGYYANKYNISYPLLLAVIQSESNGDPAAVSRAGALGLAQIMPATARDVTNDPAFREEELFHPDINLDIAAQYIHTIKGWVDKYYPYLDQKTRIDFIASAYNAGWSRVRRANGIPNILETRNYVQRVHHYHDLYEQYLFATAQI